MCDGIGEVHEIPISIIRRPLEPIIDEAKVESLVCSLNTQKEDEIPPVTVMWITGSEGGNHYYAFGGCHRYHAYKKMGRETIPAIIQKATIEQLRAIMGGSTPDLK